MIKLDGGQQVEFMEELRRLSTMLTDIHKCSAKWAAKAMLLEEDIKKTLGIPLDAKP